MTGSSSEMEGWKEHVSETGDQFRLVRVRWAIKRRKSRKAVAKTYVPMLPDMDESCGGVCCGGGRSGRCLQMTLSSICI